MEQWQLPAGFWIGIQFLSLVKTFFLLFPLLSMNFYSTYNLRCVLQDLAVLLTCCSLKKFTDF